VLPLKRVVHALDLRSHILQTFEQAELREDKEKLDKMMNFTVVGGGPTGVEVSGALAELRNHILPSDYPDLDFSMMQINLVEGSDRLLNGMSEKSGNEALKALQKIGVNVRLNSMVKSFDDGIVKLNEGELESDSVIWAAGVRGNIVDGISTDVIMKGRILVDEYNRVKGRENVFAIGDVAMMQTEEYPNGHPMMAPVAMQQGVHLASNFKRLFSGKEPEPFEYFDKGSMATIGRNKAVVDMPNGLHFKGFFAWLIWMFVHILYLIGFRNKLITLNNWIWSYLTYDKGTRLIIRTFSAEQRRKASQDE